MSNAETLRLSIASLEKHIKELRDQAQYAEGNAYREEMSRVAEANKGLAYMKKQLVELEAAAAQPAVVNGSSPFDFFGDDEPVQQATAPLTLVQPIVKGPGLYPFLSNEAYHTGPGVSKSGLDYIASNPSSYVWAKTAPVDIEKLDAMEMGTALHCLLLEPKEFNKRFIQAPVFDRRTNKGKEAEAEFLAEHVGAGKTILDHEQHRKLMIMRDSVMAHPVARMIFELEGQNEASIYWNDDETGELCRCRPDRIIDFNGHPVVVDVKKVASLDRFTHNVHEHRYHVQDAMYREGYAKHFGFRPDFWFLAVSESINAGRYPVTVVQLPSDWVADGHELYRRDLNTYHECRVNDDWLVVPELIRPRWA
jgi:exodeoxyribonuclease VIII